MLNKKNLVYRYHDIYCYADKDNENLVHLYIRKNKANFIGKLFQKNNTLYYLKDVSNRKVYYFKKYDSYTISSHVLDLCNEIKDDLNVTILYTTSHHTLVAYPHQFYNQGRYLDYGEGYYALKVSKWEIDNVSNHP
jgi:hypothetical protein